MSSTSGAEFTVESLKDQNVSTFLLIAFTQRDDVTLLTERRFNIAEQPGMWMRSWFCCQNRLSSIIKTL